MVSGELTLRRSHATTGQICLVVRDVLATGLLVCGISGTKGQTSSAMSFYTPLSLQWNASRWHKF